MIQPNPHLDAITRDSDILGDRGGVIYLDRNERPSPFPPAVFQAMLARLTPEQFTTYPDLGPLYRQLQALTGRPLEELCLGAGSDALIRRAFQAFVRPGDRVVSPDPSYGMYPVWTRIFQGQFVPVPYDAALRLDPDRLERAVLDGARLVAIARPDQPTGVVMAEAELIRIIRAARSVGALCLVDEAYFPFHPATMADAVTEFDNLLVTRTFSKASGIAGLRVGFAMAQPRIIRALHTVRSPGEVNAVGAAVAGYLLDHPEITAGYVAAVAAGREMLLEQARALGFDGPPCAGNFQLLRLPAGLEPAALVETVRRRGYLIKGGYTAPGLAGCVRVTLDGPAVMTPFLKVFSQAVAELSSGPGPA